LPTKASEREDWPGGTRVGTTLSLPDAVSRSMIRPSVASKASQAPSGEILMVVRAVMSKSGRALPVSCMPSRLL